MPAIEAQLPSVPQAAVAASDPRAAMPGVFGDALALLLTGTGEAAEPAANPSGQPTAKPAWMLGSTTPPGGFQLPAMASGTPSTGPDTGIAQASAAADTAQQATTASSPSGAAVVLPPMQTPDAPAATAAPAEEAPTQPRATTGATTHPTARPRRKADDSSADSSPATSTVAAPAVPVTNAPVAPGETPASTDRTPAEEDSVQPVAQQTKPQARTTAAGPELPSTQAVQNNAPNAAQQAAPSVAAVHRAADASTPELAPPIVAAPVASPPDAAQAAEKPASHTAAPSAAQQVAPALISVAQSSNGAQRLTLRLQPAELGTVEVHVDRSAGTPVRVEIVVQRAETLNLLLRDQPQLQHALDQAGLSPNGRSLTLHMAPPSTSSAGTGAFASLGQGTGNGYQPGGSSQASPQAQTHDSDDGDAADPGMPAAPRWLRAGLDITA